MAEAARIGQIIRPPNNLKKKIGGSMASVDPAAIARAEAALASLSSNFDEWIADEVTKLETARKKVDEGELAGPSGKALHVAAHDLKGLGTTYGYPMVTQMADSLSDIISTQALRDVAPLFLVDAHVDAIRAVVKNNIKESSHPVGSALLQELRKNVKSFLDKIS